MTDNTIISFDEPNETMSSTPREETPTYIKIIGVGGGGCNAVNHMYNQGITGVDFVVCNTDRKSLQDSPVPTQLGLATLGAGNNPERARKAALAKSDEIKALLEKDTRMLFITAGMGGGTGTGAAPVIAEIAKGITLENDDDIEKILVVAVVTYPFTFEGPKRLAQADAGIAELRKYVDSILVINNEKLRDFGNNTLSAAFVKANDVLLTAAKGIAEIITVSARIAIDFQDVNAVMQNSGTALMGVGRASGTNRAEDAIKMASESPLLNDNNIAGAKDILLFFSYSPEHEITMDELSIVTETVTTLTGDRNTNVIWGEGPDDSLTDELVVTLIATGFNKKQYEQENTPRIPLPIEPEPSNPEYPQNTNNNGAPANTHPYNNGSNTPTNNTPLDVADDTEMILITSTSSKETEKANTIEEPVKTPEGPQIYILEDETIAQPIAESETVPEDTIEDDGIVLIKAPKSEIGIDEPIQKQTYTGRQQTDNHDFMALSRAERIKAMTARFKQSPDESIEYFERTPASEILGEDISTQEYISTEAQMASELNITADGTLVNVQNQYINNRAD